MSRIVKKVETIICDHCGVKINEDVKEIDSYIHIGKMESFDYCEECNKHLMEFSIKCESCHDRLNIKSDTIGGKPVK